jgi:MerR family transcriptional regulator, redox-sensitive transcriptional activator SoxR
VYDVTDVSPDLTIGELAHRSGVAASALRYYETLGLIRADRTPGGQRTYARSTLRRVAFVRAAQRVGLSLNEARDAMAALPADRAPDATQWSHVARAWQRRIDHEIEALRTLRANLTGCIGCGCLSLRTCKIYNPDDAAAELGAGARYLLGDSSEDIRIDRGRPSR